MDMLGMLMFGLITCAGVALIRLLGTMRYARRTGHDLWEGLLSKWASERAWGLPLGAWLVIWFASCAFGPLVTMILLER